MMTKMSQNPEYREERCNKFVWCRGGGDKLIHLYLTKKNLVIIQKKIN